MNVAIILGRLTRDPVIKASQSGMTIARFTLAVNRLNKTGQNPEADFINCVAFGKTADAIGNYVYKGQRLLVEGRIQTGSYTNRDGNKVYTTDVVVEDQEFAESKAASQANGNNYTPARPEPSAASGDGFMNIPDGIDEELPFN